MSDVPDVQLPTPATNEERIVVDSFTLQIVSPSVGVNGPLIFSELPVETTVKELKAKIRAALPMQPPDESQRLIHRGRLLSKETDTMSEIFGKDTLKNPESHTLHLVLRPANSNSPALPGTLTPSAQAEVQGGGPGIALGGNGSLAPNFSQLEQRLPDMPNNLPQDNTAQNHQQVHQRLQATLQAVHHHHTLQAQHHAALQNMNNHLNRLQREAERIHRDLDAVERHHMQHHHHNHHQIAVPGGIQQTAVAQTSTPPIQVPPGFPVPYAPVSAFQNVRMQYHRDRIAMGTQGPQINGNSGVAGSNALPHDLSNAGHPERTSTFTREGTGPNGERWQVTVNETTTVIPTADLLQGRSVPPTLPPRDVQHVLGALDHLQRGTPQPLPSRQDPNITEFTAPTVRQGTDDAAASPRPASSVSDLNVPGPAPPLVPTAAPNASSQPSPTTSQIAEGDTMMPHSLNSPMVYILSSPNGPRALLLNGSQMYFTPRRIIESDAAQHAQNNAAIGNINTPIQPRNRRDGRFPRAQPRQAHVEGAPAHPAHPANPNAAAAAVQAWPHLWLAIRLLGFIWFFTSGNSSWTRCILVSGLALAFFLMQAGLLNGIAETFYGPLRRHLEALLPLAGPQPPAANPAPPGQNHHAAQQAPNPESTAQRLIAQRRRANGSWLWLQLRRVEHATILFLASLIPGVGERHIAARAAEATEAERQRQQAETTAAAAAAVVAAPPAAEGRDEGQRATSGPTGSDLPAERPESSPAAERADARSGAGEAPAQAPPLVEI